MLVRVLRGGGTTPAPTEFDVDLTKCDKTNNCVAIGDNYSRVATYKLSDSIKLEVKGMLSGNKLHMTGATKKEPSHIEVSGINGVKKIEFDWEGGNASKATGNIFEVIVGTNTKTESFAKNEARKTTTYEFNDASATSFKIKPQNSTVNDNKANRIYAYGVKFTTY